MNDVFQAVGLHVVVNKTDFEGFKLATLTLDVVNGEVDKVVAPDHNTEVKFYGMNVQCTYMNL